MARVTIENCIDIIPNRFDLVMVATHRARQIFSGDTPLVDAGDKKEKAPVLALREIEEDHYSAEDLMERTIQGNQTQIEVDEPDNADMSVLMGEDGDMGGDDTENEVLLRALMAAQGTPADETSDEMPE